MACQFAGRAGGAGFSPLRRWVAASICRLGGNRLPSAVRRIAGSPANPNWPIPCIHERMDFTALPGLAPLLDPLSLTIVGGGTAAAVVLRTPLRDFIRGIGALRILPRRRFDAEPLLAQIAALTRIAKRHGLIALDRSVIEDPDVAAAVAASVDGASPADIEALLLHLRTRRSERHRAAFEVWSGAAEAAPAMGMIGTLIGLVQMFTAMRDPATIGGAMALALLTTLYGAALANLIALPIAARLKRKARLEMQERARYEGPLVMLAGIEPSVRSELRGRAAA